MEETETIEENYFYIINRQEDYADEFDYPIISFLSEKQRAFIILHYNTWKEFDFDGCYFGTNEALDLNAARIISFITDAHKVSEDDFKIINPYLLVVPSVDIINTIVEKLYDRYPDMRSELDTLFEEN